MNIYNKCCKHFYIRSTLRHQQAKNCSIFKDLNSNIQRNIQALKECLPLLFGPFYLDLIWNPFGWKKLQFMGTIKTLIKSNRRRRRKLEYHPQFYLAVSWKLCQKERLCKQQAVAREGWRISFWHKLQCAQSHLAHVLQTHRDTEKWRKTFILILTEIVAVFPIDPARFFPPSLLFNCSHRTLWELIMQTLFRSNVEAPRLAIHLSEVDIKYECSISSLILPENVRLLCSWVMNDAFPEICILAISYISPALSSKYSNDIQNVGSLVMISVQCCHCCNLTIHREWAHIRTAGMTIICRQLDLTDDGHGQQYYVPSCLLATQHCIGRVTTTVSLSLNELVLERSALHEPAIVIKRKQ